MATAKSNSSGNRSTGSGVSAKKAAPAYKTLGVAARVTGSSPDSAKAQKVTRQWQGKAPKSRSTPKQPRK